MLVINSVKCCQLTVQLTNDTGTTCAAWWHHGWGTVMQHGQVFLVFLSAGFVCPREGTEFQRFFQTTFAAHGKMPH